MSRFTKQIFSKVVTRSSTTLPRNIMAMNVPRYFSTVTEKPILPEKCMGQLFDNAYTAHGFFDKKVDHALLEKALLHSQYGPTSFNTLPMRVVFVESTEGKNKLETALMPGNIAQTSEAPVTAILCFDEEFIEKLPYLSPNYDAHSFFKANLPWVEPTMVTNGFIQIGYFILALRAVGLDVGPMTGFDPAKVDELFLQDTTWKSKVLVNIGYSNPDKNYPRGGKHTMEQATKFV